MRGLLATFKDYAHQASVGVALILIFELGQVVTYKLAMGHPFPANYDTWLWALVTLAGVNVAGMGVIRATSPNLAAIKAAGKAAGPPQVNVENATVQTEAPEALPAKPAVPRAGDKPRDPAVVAGVEAIAAKQGAAADVDGEGD